VVSNGRPGVGSADTPLLRVDDMSASDVGVRRHDAITVDLRGDYLCAATPRRESWLDLPRRGGA
jgi:hypothetical protein